MVTVVEVSRAESEERRVKLRVDRIEHEVENWSEGVANESENESEEDRGREVLTVMIETGI